MAPQIMHARPALVLSVFLIVIVIAGVFSEDVLSQKGHASDQRMGGNGVDDDLERWLQSVAG